MSKNTDNRINCPECGTTIDIDDILRSNISSEIESNYKEKWVKRLDLFKEQEKKLNDQKNLIIKAQKEYDDKFNNALEEKLKTEKEIISKNVKDKLEEEQSLSIAAMKKELSEQNIKIKEFNLQKTELEKIKREKDLLKEELNSEFEKKYNENLEKEKVKIVKNENDRVELKILEQNKKIEDLVKELENAKRKAEQGSVQVQGEVQEVAIEDWLSSQFPLDQIVEVKKGQRGADCLQTVNTYEKPGCGKILYESKRTKEFQNNWIEKFKNDIRDKKADVGILVTSAMPSDMDRFGMKDGIWICNFDEFKGLSAVIRETVILISKDRKNQENVTDKATILYNYLTSNEFNQTMKGIIEGFNQMKKDLDYEKNAMQRIWNRREKQIERVLTNTNYFYGSVQGIGGTALPFVNELSLGGIADLEEELEEGDIIESSN